MGRALECSVVIIAYNAESTLGDCIKSIRGQSLPPSEIIVVDNGSTDSTADIALSLGVRVIREQRRGRGKARNTGVTAARGRLIAFTDSDAIASEDWLKRLVEHYRSNEEAGVSGNVYARNPERLIPRLIDLIIKDVPHYATWNILYDRRVLMEVGLFNDRLKNAEDVELAWRTLSEGYRIGFEPKAIVYHIHREELRQFLYQQFDFGRWSIRARKISGMPTWRAKLLIIVAPFTFFKHLFQARKHPLLPFLLAMSSMAYALGTLTGLLIGLGKCSHQCARG